MDSFSEFDHEVTRLEVDSVLLEYEHRKLLQNIYLRVEKGEIVGLLGRNGSGKSSLLEVIYGIRATRNCSVRVDNKFIRKAYRHENFIAYLPQKPFVSGHLKVREALMLYKSQIGEAINYFPEVEQLLAYRFDKLSGGQQRLIETIMVISSPASFIILDEPFSNIMPLHIESVKTWLSALKKKKGILVTDHYYRDVLAISDHMYLLNMDGRTIKLQEPIKQLQDFGYIS